MMKPFKICAALLIMLSAPLAYGEVPITTDSRIKTFVYNENEVYPIVVHYGYQSSIEFGPGEEAETTSIGDSYAWKISRVGSRLFIKTLESNAHTNMTVITNKRTYQFDILSKMPDQRIDQELVYVVRFFYPDTNQQFDKRAREQNIMPAPVQQPYKPQGTAMPRVAR